MKIIVDAMGGDNAPDEIIKGCALALKEFDIDEIILLGDEKAVQNSVEKNNVPLDKFRIVHCSEVIGNCD